MFDLGQVCDLLECCRRTRLKLLRMRLAGGRCAACTPLQLDPRSDRPDPLARAIANKKGGPDAERLSSHTSSGGNQAMPVGAKSPVVVREEEGTTGTGEYRQYNSELPADFA